MPPERKNKGILGFKGLYVIMHFLCIGLLFVWPVNKLGVNTNSNNSKCSAELVTATAVNDNFVLALGCEKNSISGNLLLNDDVNPDSLPIISIISNSEFGELEIDTLGNFTFILTDNYLGELQFSYRLTTRGNNNLYSDASVTVIVDNDNDCDEVADFLDIDDDNDGILDYHEELEGIDFDEDGIPNSKDIDSDNDGITDFIEWQTEKSVIWPVFTDSNNDGWDDAFDASLGGNYYEQVDTDMDGSPDFVDTDSDSDDISDLVEANDIDNDQILNCMKLNSDLDFDGLDDIFDNVHGWANKTNALGSNSVLPDYNGNGIRDWRDETNHTIPSYEIQLGADDVELFVYPNPVKDICTVLVPVNNESETKSIYIKLFNSEGKLLHLQEVTTTNFTLNLGNYSKGNFFIHVRNGEKAYYSHILKI